MFLHPIFICIVTVDAELELVGFELVRGLVLEPTVLAFKFIYLTIHQ